MQETIKEHFILERDRKLNFTSTIMHDDDDDRLYIRDVEMVFEHI
jgi:hypothetical protein